MYTFCTVNLGDAFLAKGDLTLAREKFDEALDIAADPKTHEWMKWRYTLHLYASLGEYWLARGDAPRAVEFAERSLAMSRPTRSLKYVTRALRILGDAARTERRWEDAERALRSLSTSPGHRASESDLEDRAGSRPPSRGHRRPRWRGGSLAAARQTIERMRNRVQDPRLLAGLTGGPLIRAVFDPAPFD